MGDHCVEKMAQIETVIWCIVSTFKKRLDRCYLCLSVRNSAYAVPEIVLAWVLRHFAGWTPYNTWRYVTQAIALRFAAWTIVAEFDVWEPTEALSSSVDPMLVPQPGTIRTLWLWF